MMGRAGCFLCLFTGMAFAAPDINSVKPDLAFPPLSKTQPAAGVRVKQTHPHWAKTSVYHTLYLPIIIKQHNINKSFNDMG